MHPIYDKLYDTVFVVCYEAGAAEVISSLVKNKHFYKNLKVFTQGPASKIFKKKLSYDKNASFNDILDLKDNDILLTGRSLVPELEREALSLAKKNNIKSISYLDHWVNFENFAIPLKYRENISQDIKDQYIPDYILVGDKYAYKIAQSYYKDKVFLIENEYFNDLRNEAKLLKIVNSDIKSLLFICDPLSIDNKELYNNHKKYGFDEFDIIKEIIENFYIFEKKGLSQLIIRPHPNHEFKAFNEEIAKLLPKNNNINIVIDNHTTLLEQVVSAEIVLGIESMALVVAIELNKTAISYIPNVSQKKLSLLPHSEIIKTNDLQKVKW